jgi:2-keto-3-deoxy-galactonokinase
MVNTTDRPMLIGRDWGTPSLRACLMRNPLMIPQGVESPDESLAPSTALG